MAILMTPEHEIWRPASVKTMPGHVLVGRKNIEKYSGRVYLSLSHPELPCIHDAVIAGNSMSGEFILVNSVVYYIDGGNGVYETNILYPLNVHFSYFRPIGVRDDNTPVLFRRLHKLEWLFA